MGMSKRLIKAIIDFEDVVLVQSPTWDVRNAYEKVLDVRCDELSLRGEAILRAIYHSSPVPTDNEIGADLIEFKVRFDVYTDGVIQELLEQRYVRVTVLDGRPVTFQLTQLGERVARHYEQGYTRC